MYVDLHCSLLLISMTLHVYYYALPTSVQLKLDTSAYSKEANTVKYIVETVAPKAEMDSKTTQ